MPEITDSREWCLLFRGKDVKRMTIEELIAGLEWSANEIERLKGLECWCLLKLGDVKSCPSHKNRKSSLTETGRGEGLLPK